MSTIDSHATLYMYRCSTGLYSLCAYRLVQSWLSAIQCNEWVIRDPSLHAPGCTGSAIIDAVLWSSVFSWSEQTRVRVGRSELRTHVEIST